MAEQVTEEPRGVVLSVNCIVAGTFIRAGDPTPFEREEDLPESLKPFVATGDETPFNPAERDIYSVPPGIRRQVRRLEMQAAHQEFAEQVAAEPLPPETAAVLQAEHDIIG